MTTTPVAAWLAEAKLMAESHPSKDCRFFAAQAEDIIRQARADALREAAFEVGATTQKLHRMADEIEGEK